MRFFFGYSRLALTFSRTMGCLLGIAAAANAQINVLSVDCNPFTSPNITSFGPDNTMGMSLQQVDTGGLFNVTEVPPAAFRALTAAQLAAFDLIAINNNPRALGGDCGDPLGLGTTWHSVVGVNSGGRVFLCSHDAARFKITVPPGAGFFGAGSPGPGVEPFGADDLIRQAALWAGGGSGTGLMIFNDSARFNTVGGVGWDNPELNLPAAWGISDLDQFGSGFGDGGYTDILPAFAGHPIYAGLSDARFGVNSISSFAANASDNSGHSIFATYNPAIFTPTEVVINAGVVDVGGFNATYGIGSGVPAPGPDGSAISLIRDEQACPPGTEDADRLLLFRHSFLWTDPESGGEVRMTENVYEGCRCNPDNPNPFGCDPTVDMTFEWVVENIDYDPEPGITNGFSGFQLNFPGPVPELCNQQSPTVGGPWGQNAFSGISPPFGAEWDAPLPGVGIMPGETGVFSFCTAERFDVVVEIEGAGQGPAGWGHSWGACSEPIIDADGTASPGDGIPGAVEVSCGTPLTSWPTGGYIEGLDMFDNDHSGTWTFGDDLHVEDPTTHPGAIRDALHDDGLDPIVLDYDNSLNSTPGAEPVSCDMETGTFCPAGLPGNMKFYDASGNGFWDDGEDIVLDTDGSGTWGQIVNTQTYIFHGFQSVPGDMFPEQRVLGQTCDSDRRLICKKVKYADEDGDGLIEVGEPIQFRQFIVVHNPGPMVWRRTVVEDRFGAELDCEIESASHGTAALSTKGNSDKEFLVWDIGPLGPDGVATLELVCRTDLNPGGQQEYSECSYHEFNSGAVLKFRGTDNKQRSFESGQIIVSVLTEDALGDCDGDGFSDADELECGTDPHIPAIDRVIDADGTASAGDGIPAALDTPCGATLSDFPVTGAADAGLDWFDNDNNGRWTFGFAGDDLHSEDPNTCPTAIRDGVHQLGADCKILDYNASLFTGQQVNCDLEVNAPFTEPHLSNGGCPSALNNIRYYDANGDGSWDDGEDIILDTNGNGIFD